MLFVSTTNIDDMKVNQRESLFITGPLKWDFISSKMISDRKRNVDTAVVKNVTCMRAIKGQQPTSFDCVNYVIVRMKIDLSASFRIVICSE